MESKIELTSMEAKPVLSVRVATTIEDLPALINDSYRRIADYMTELGESPVGAPFVSITGRMPRALISNWVFRIREFARQG